MPLIRILVDGYSLLHAWPELARGKARHSEQARNELIDRLTRYQDLTGTPITVFFDGNGPKARKPRDDSGKPVEVLYSSAAKTADDLIERAAFRFASYGQVMVVTNDYAEKDTVLAAGGVTCGCEKLHSHDGAGGRESGKERPMAHNRREAGKFQTSRREGRL